MTVDTHVQQFLLALKASAFSGEIRTDYAARLTVATDNSVYQVIPQAVLLPKTTQDIATVLQLSQQDHFKNIKFAPRGGGTGTNGQSLSAGIIIDCSKYMREILEINVDKRWVRVQPGVVLDQLNAALKSVGMHFAPEISPSNRATIGGMINTDACGNGSKVIGRTSDHLIDLTCVLSDGHVIHTADVNEKYCTPLAALLAPKQALIKEKFKERPRNLNGYNLLKTYSGTINLNYLFAGSEGTLGIISEATLKITPIPQFKKLVLVKYRCFDDALRMCNIKDSQSGEGSHSFEGVVVIESIDEQLLDVARSDDIYFKLKDMMDGDVKSGAVNLVEFVAKSEEELKRVVQQFCENSYPAIGYYIAKNEAETKLLWELRKKSVGLISKRQQGTRRPIPFVEDTAVPPEKLADYINEFKMLLDQHNLIYGMYGHVDAGCVHVRPALDLKQSADEKLFQQLSNDIANLVEKFGGVMWGEHGMGFRCHYAEHFFGEELYTVVRQIKTLFDPDNRLNPGKIATPVNSQEGLVNIAGPLRAQFDKQIPVAVQEEYATTMACNGNGACFNYATQDAMCPSFKVTKERIHSPKGRATVMREWLRLTQHSSSATPTTESEDFSHEVYDAMNGCLSCKACAFQCPLNVDVPEFKAKFLSQYHQRYRRPLRDYMIAFTENMAVIQSRFPRVSAWFLQNKVTAYMVKKLFKLVDIPAVNSVSLKQELIKRNITTIPSKKENAVILLQDTFTTFYDTTVFLNIIDCLTQLGIQVGVASFSPNGKPLHVKGFLSRFSTVAKKNIKQLRELAKSNIPIVGIDPSITLTYRDEYKKLLSPEPLGFEVQLLQEWLITKKSLLAQTSLPKQLQTYYLLSHCTEKTACVASEKLWQEIYAAAGLTLVPLAAGCCGMAGAYGHELEHLDLSKKLFSMDWERYLQENSQPEKTLLATGYSCRSQAKRLTGVKLQHPLEALMSVIQK